MKKKYEKPTIISEVFAAEMMQAGCEENGEWITPSYGNTYYNSCNCEQEANMTS